MIGLTSTNVGAQNTRNIFSGTNVNTSNVYAGIANHDDFTPDDSVNIYVGVFFDGTANNRDNTDSRLAYERIEAHEKKENGETLTPEEVILANAYTGSTQEKESAEAYEGWLWGTKSGSYDNDKSNIAKMEACYNDLTTEKIIQTHVYIEGAGTSNGSKDSVFGLGLGTGGTGVREKVEKACREVASAVKNAAGDLEINKLIIDVYGFSRGAAEARNFVFEISQKAGDRDIEATIYPPYSAPIYVNYAQNHGYLGKQFTQEGVELEHKLDIRFAGLYDTVLAVGMGFSAHERNVRQLNMVAVNKSRFVFQIAAADEHRSNFKLTNISRSHGLEITIPGVHSDIGGGYVDNADDNVTLKSGHNISQIQNEQTFLINQGWYKSDEISILDIYGGYGSGMYGGGNPYYLLYGKKKKVSSKYSFIPLQIMTTFSVSKKVDILESKILRKFSINGIDTLTKAKTELDSYVLGTRNRFKFDNFGDKELIKTLRNEYFHWSANLDSIGMGPNIVNGTRERHIFDG